MNTRKDEPGPQTARAELPTAAYGSALVWFLAVFGIGLVTTLAAANQFRNSEELRARAQFDFAANAIVNEVIERLDSHVQAMWGVAGLLSLNPASSRSDWRSFIDSTRLFERLPGTQAIGYGKLVRAQDRAAHVAAMRREGFANYRIWPSDETQDAVAVTFMKPITERTPGILGFDLSTDPTRRLAIERARDWGTPVVSGRLSLIREPDTNPQPGFLLFVPIFSAGMPAATIDERRVAIVGYAYSAFRARDFVVSRGLTQRLQDARAALEIYDGVGVRDDNLLYRSPDFPSAASLSAAPARMETIAEIVGVRTWTFRIASVSSALAVDTLLLRIILIGGLLVSVLTGAVVSALALNRSQAVLANARLRADMAQRIAVEAQLRDSEAKFRRLFDSIPLPTFAVERGTLRYFAVNDAAVEKYGYSHDEFSRMRITDLRPLEDVPSIVEFMKGVRNIDSYSGEFRHSLRDGSTIDVEVAGHAIELDGRALAIVIANDITERKQAERALAETEQQLRQVQKLEAIGQLTGGIAHDFNNILTVITGTIEILADAVADDPKLAAIARLIDEAATRGAETTRGLLAFARRQPLDPRETDVNALVSGAMKLFRSTLGEHIVVESRLAADLPHAFIDAGQLTTALLNLALNARDAMPEGGRLLLETDNVVIDATDSVLHRALEVGDYVLITVSDSGVGIAEAIRDKVFEPFFTTKDVGKGTGLGLSMVYGFVKQSNGHLSLYSEPGRGTTVRLYLPCADAGSLIDAGPTGSPQVEGGSETILVVEDDELVRRYVVEHLRGLGYVTRVAGNAEQALAIAGSGAEFDLLFTDIVMPGAMNGRQLAEELGRQRPGLRVLFTSGYSGEAAIRNGHFATGDFILNKPYRRANLARKVREALDTAELAGHKIREVEQGAVK